MVRDRDVHGRALAHRRREVVVADPEAGDEPQELAVGADGERGRHVGAVERHGDGRRVDSSGSIDLDERVAAGDRGRPGSTERRSRPAHPCPAGPSPRAGRKRVPPAWTARKAARRSTPPGWLLMDVLQSRQPGMTAASVPYLRRSAASSRGRRRRDARHRATSRAGDATRGRATTSRRCCRRRPSRGAHRCRRPARRPRALPRGRCRCRGPAARRRPRTRPRPRVRCGRDARARPAAVAVCVRDEHVMLGVDARERLELGGGKVRLRAAEAAARATRAEPLEHGEPRCPRRRREAADDDAVDVAGLHRSSMRAPHGRSHRRRGPSF